MDKRLAAFSVAVMMTFMSCTVGLLMAFVTSFPQQTAQAPESDFFDSSFWNISETESLPLDISNHSTTSTSYDGDNGSLDIVEWRFDYLSESHKGEDVRINSVLLRRADVSAPAPSVLFLHGYGEDYQDYIQVLRQIASDGFVVMAIDHPGAGNSTGYPRLGPRTFLNVTTGPSDASLYHSVWAAARAVTLLETLSMVDTNATVVAGASMGGLVTYIVSAVDSRIDGTIPIISGGNLLNAITSGSLINSVIEPSYSVGSEELQNIVRWFDPLGYAPSLSKPVLMMFGTDDQFFPLVSLMDTVDVIQADLTLSIIPNWGHMFHPSWGPQIASWMASTYNDNSSLSEPDVSYSPQLTILGGGVHVTAEVSGQAGVLVCWRSTEPGAVWSVSLMPLRNDNGTYEYSQWIMPISIGTVFFFVLTASEDGGSTSSRIYSTTAGSLLFPLGLVLSFIGLLAIIRMGLWRPRVTVFIREVPYLIGVLMIVPGFLLPFLTIGGRASLSLLGFLEVYGGSFRLSGWFLPLIVLGLSLVLSLSAFRQRFQFRMAALLWTPVMLIIVALYIIFGGVFAYFADLFLVRTGVGGLFLLLGIPAMQILDKLFRDYVPWTEYIANVQEDDAE